MRMIAMLLLFAACSDDPTPNDVVTCDPAWTSQNNGCERACAAHPASTGPACVGNNDVGLQRGCADTFTYEGKTGCCMYTVDPSNSSETVVRFYECQ